MCSVSRHLVAASRSLRQAVANPAGAVTAGLVSGGAGLVIGVAAHAAKSVTHIRKRAAESPYRYLTTIEKAGVIFRRNLN